MAVWLCSPAGAAEGLPAGDGELNSLHSIKGQSYKLHGTLFLPEDGAPIHPALVIIHGTLGIDSRNEFYRETLLKAGIATFEVDFKTGVFAHRLRSAQGQRLRAHELRGPEGAAEAKAIDPERIGIMGFSLGGHRPSTRPSSRTGRPGWATKGVRGPCGVLCS